MSPTMLPANRVLQLEASILDNEFNRIVDTLIGALDIPRFAEELKLVTKLYVMAYHLRSGTTIGMKTYNINLQDANDRLMPKGYKLALLATLNLLLPYVGKSDTVRSSIRDNKLKFRWLNYDNLEATMKILRMLNFLSFIRYGKYLLLQHRMIGITQVIDPDISYDNFLKSKVQMEIIHRETIWMALAEFLAKILPHVNVPKLSDRLLRTLGLKPSFDRKLSLADRVTKKHHSVCSICDKQPFNPYVIGCKHVFCYYCLFANHENAPEDGFICYRCNYQTMDRSQVAKLQPVIGTWHKD